MQYRDPVGICVGKGITPSPLPACEIFEDQIIDRRFVRGCGRTEIPPGTGATPDIGRRHQFSHVRQRPAVAGKLEKLVVSEANDLVAGWRTALHPTQQIRIGGGAVEIVDAVELQCAHGLILATVSFADTPVLAQEISMTSSINPE